MQYLYLIRDSEGIYKIGITNDPDFRLAQLQTGNPRLLELLSCYGYEDASSVERAIHQTFGQQRIRGEWFSLDNSHISKFEMLCQALGGQQYSFLDNSAPEEAIEEAEQVEESIMTDGAKWDYSQMFADGWHMYVGGNGRGRFLYWCWRKRRKGESDYIYGGKLVDLPHPIEEMRRIYGGKQ